MGASFLRSDAEIDETVRGVPVKKVAIRYPLVVTRFEVDPEANPWGLALDCFAEDGPARLDLKHAGPAAGPTPTAGATPVAGPSGG